MQIFKSLTTTLRYNFNLTRPMLQIAKKNDALAMAEFMVDMAWET